MFMAWPGISRCERKEPDFLLYGDDVGLVVFEVKDWALKIRGAGKNATQRSVKRSAG